MVKPGDSVFFTLLRQNALWQSTGRNGLLGFGGFCKDSTRLAAGCFTSGFTILEVVYASAIAAVAVLALYSTIMIGYAMICANQQRLDAEALAFDKTLEIFNTYAFTLLAQNSVRSLEKIPRS